MTKRKAGIYMRVSTYDQTTENQRIALEHLADSRGWEVVGIYRDQAVSGASYADKRPSMRKMLEDMKKSKINVIMAWSIDRLGRSTIDLLNTLALVHECGANLVVHQQNMDTTTPEGKAMFGLMAVFAEFERELIRRRVKAGLVRAKSEGRQLGRPRLKAHVVEQVCTLIKTTNFPYEEIARISGASYSFVEKQAREIPSEEKTFRR